LGKGGYAFDRYAMIGGEYNDIYSIDTRSFGTL
jgi:hypothetical protein